MNVYELREKLEVDGYEGLYCTDERCGCGLDYLVACGEPIDGDEGILAICKPAYKHTCIGEDCAYPCDGYLPGHEGDCYGPSKDGPKRREPEVMGNYAFDPANGAEFYYAKWVEAEAKVAELERMLHLAGYETVACGPRIADGGLVTKEGDHG